MVLFGVPARKDRRQRCRAPAVTPDNYTGNFVCTTALSIDANRSATSLLPQRFFNQLCVETIGTNCTKPRVSTVCSVAILTIYARGVGKVTRFDYFCRSLENNSLARCFGDDQRSKEVRKLKTHGHWSVWSTSPSHQNKAEGSTSPIFIFDLASSMCVCKKAWHSFISPLLLARGPLVAGHSLGRV